MKKGDEFMADIKENTVSAENQLKREDSVFGKKGTGKRILFLGNSITRHGPNASLGWLSDWGMAASSVEKDYVHRTMARALAKDPDVSFLVGQISPWERHYWVENFFEERFPELIEYNADIIVLRAIENVPAEELENHDFRAAVKSLIDTLNPDGTAKVVLTSAFWPAGERDRAMLDVAAKYGYRFVHLGDLGVRDEYTAKGLFEHSGVAAHPGNKGMDEIARRIFFAIEDWI